MKRATLLLALLGPGCKAGREVPVLQVDAATGPELIPESFDELFPLFLLRKVDPGPKAQLWNRYKRRWIRWNGKLVSVTRNGATFRHLPQTLTFDVSVFMEPAGREKLTSYAIGEHVTYIGQLSDYDDVFRTFYIVHGDVVPRGAVPVGVDASASDSRR